MTAVTQEVRDSAKRMCDAINLHVTAGALGLHDRVILWVALNIADGRSDGNIYDSRVDAARFTDNLPGTYFYCKVGVDYIQEKEAILVLQQHRQSFARGVRFRDEQVVTPILSELLMPFIPNTLRELGMVNRRPTMTG